jgi:hypothetical protein
MPEKKQDSWQIVSVRLPHELTQRLDRYLDWSAVYRRIKSSRNAAIREALSNWLDEQEQLAGFLDPEAQRKQFQAAYRSVAKRHDWVPIHRLRQLVWQKYSNAPIYQKLPTPDFLPFDLIFNSPESIVRTPLRTQNTWRVDDGLEDDAGLCHRISR